VLGGVDYSDSSRIIWVLTPEFGRQSLIAKGARRPKSKYLGLIETFNLVRVIYRKSRSGSLFVLREVDLQRHFGGIRASLEAFWTASVAVELIKEVAREEQESRALFELLKEFLSLADSSQEEEETLKALLVVFRWRLAALLGFSPRLVECVGCGAKLSRSEKYRFLLVEGGLLCSDCQARPLPAGEIAFGLSYQALRAVYRSCRKFPTSAADLSALLRQELEIVEPLSRRYLEHHLGIHQGLSIEKLRWPSTGESVRAGKSLSEHSGAAENTK